MLTFHHPFIDNPTLAGAVGEAVNLTRSSLALVKDVNGHLRTALSGEPRFQGTTIRQNNIPYPDDLTNVLWVKTNLAIAEESVDVPSAPNCTKSWTFTDDTATGVHYVREAAVAAYNQDGRLVHSVYLKQGTKRYAAFAARDYNGQPVRVSILDLQTGTVTADGNQQTGETLVDVGNGWYRFYCYRDPVASTSDDMYIGIADGPDSSDAEYTGDGSGTILVSSPQVEGDCTRSVGTPTNYMPNTGSIVSHITGANDGLVHEPARTNVITRNDNFSHADWDTGADALIDDNATTAPDGRLNADRLKDDNAGGNGAVFARQTNRAAVSGDNVWSCYVKKDGLDWCSLRTTAYDAGADGETFFDLDAGVVGTVDPNHTAGIEVAAEGFYRVWVSFNTTTDLSGHPYVYAADSDGDRSVALDDTSSIFVYGAQLEAGTKPTSLIKTVASSVTRNAEQVDKAGAITDPTVNDGLTMFCHAEATSLDAGNRFIYLQDDGDRVQLNVSGNNARWYSNGSGAAGDVQGTNEWVEGTPRRMVGAAAEDDFTMYSEGVLIGQDTSYGMAESISRAWIGRKDDGTNIWHGLIKEIAYFDERLTDEDLSDLSDGSKRVSEIGGCRNYLGIYRRSFNGPPKVKKMTAKPSLRGFLGD